MVEMRVEPDTWIDVNDLLGLQDKDKVGGLGHTTHQMKTAPRGAYFVWCNSHTNYAMRLSKDLGRDDLQIRSPEWLLHEARRTPHAVPIVIDHAYHEVRGHRGR